MKKVTTVSLIVIGIVLALGFLRIWTTSNIFGEVKINSYELFGNCWQGDVRVCDYDPFND